MIQKSEKGVIVATISLALIFMVALVYAMVKKEVDVVNCVPFNQQFLEAGSHRIDDKTYKVNYVASMWQFQPAQIFVPTGSEVEFFLTSKDVAHGFHISEKNINMMALYGQVTTYKTTFKTPGVYPIVCHEYCGVGHQNMVAEVIVNSPLQH